MTSDNNILFVYYYKSKKLLLFIFNSWSFYSNLPFVLILWLCCNIKFHSSVDFLSFFLKEWISLWMCFCMYRLECALLLHTKTIIKIISFQTCFRIIINTTEYQHRSDYIYDQNKYFYFVFMSIWWELISVLFNSYSVYLVLSSLIVIYIYITTFLTLFWVKLLACFFLYLLILTFVKRMLT